MGHSDRYQPSYDEAVDNAGGVTLTHLPSGQTVYLQPGDDANQFHVLQGNMCPIVYPHGPFHCYEEHLDAIISTFFTERFSQTEPFATAKQVTFGKRFGFDGTLAELWDSVSRGYDTEGAYHG